MVPWIIERVYHVSSPNLFILNIYIAGEGLKILLYSLTKEDTELTKTNYIYNIAISAANNWQITHNPHQNKGNKENYNTTLNNNRSNK